MAVEIQSCELGKFMCDFSVASHVYLMRSLKMEGKQVHQKIRLEEIRGKKNTHLHLDRIKTQPQEINPVCMEL